MPGELEKVGAPMPAEETCLADSAHLDAQPPAARVARRWGWLPARAADLRGAGADAAP
jgi:hypothetical protein